MERLTKFSLGSHPSGFRNAEEKADPGDNGKTRGKEVEESPALGDNDERRADSEANNDETLGSPNGAHGTVALVNEDEVLNHEGDQGFDGTGTNGLDAARSDMAVQPFAEASPETSDPGECSAEQQDRTATDSNGQGNKEIAANTVGQEREGRQQRDLPQWWATKSREGGQRVKANNAWRVQCGDVDLIENLGVDTSVLEGEDRNESSDDGFC